MTLFIDSLSGLGSTSSVQLATAPTPNVATPAGSDFGSVLAGMISGAAADVRAGEAMSISGLTGGAGVQQVVEAVGTAQDSLNITNAIRNKAVAAYQEIERMTI